MSKILIWKEYYFAFKLHFIVFGFLLYSLSFVSYPKDDTSTERIACLPREEWCFGKILTNNHDKSLHICNMFNL